MLSWLRLWLRTVHTEMHMPATFWTSLNSSSGCFQTGVYSSLNATSLCTAEYQRRPVSSSRLFDTEPLFCFDLIDSWLKKERAVVSRDKVTLTKATSEAVQRHCFWPVWQLTLIYAPHTIFELYLMQSLDRFCDAPKYVCGDSSNRCWHVPLSLFSWWFAWPGSSSPV